MIATHGMEQAPAAGARPRRAISSSALSSSSRKLRRGGIFNPSRGRGRLLGRRGAPQAGRLVPVRASLQRKCLQICLEQADRSGMRCDYIVLYLPGNVCWLFFIIEEGWIHLAWSSCRFGVIH